MPDWLSQNLISSLIFSLFTILGGILITLLKKYKQEWAGPALYGLGGAAFVALTLFVLIFALPAVIQKPPIPVTPQNVEQNMKNWADDLGISLQRQSAKDDPYPAYIARLQGGNPVQIFRAKEKPAYLQFAASLTFTQEHEAILAKMTKAQITRFITGLTLDLGKSSYGNLAFTVIFNKNASGTEIPTSVTMNFGFPISGLNASTFVTQFDELNHVSVFMQADISQTLNSFIPSSGK